jgi:hypothetical protein
MLRHMKTSGQWSVVSGQLILMTLIGVLPVAGGILPDRLAGAMKSDVKAVAPPDAALFDEYGFDAGEQATFGPSTLTAWRFRDSTGALAAFQFLRPANAKPLKSTVNQAAVRIANGAIFEYGNYVLQVVGKVPADDELAPVYLALAKVQQGPLPVLATYLPPTDLVPNSERYIVGPVSLEKFDPKIPPSLAAFHLSAEAQYGRYHGKNGDFSLAIFEYPTPGMARQRAEEFEKQPGLMAKRTGPLVAIVSDTADRDAAERVLAKISYQATLTVNEKAANHEVRSFGQTILNYIAFAGLIMVFCIFSGLLFAGVRILARRLGPKDDDGAMITLHLEGNK